MILKPMPSEPTNYQPRLGDRVFHAGNNQFLRRWFNGKTLTVAVIHSRDCGCIAESEKHLRFFRPHELTAKRTADVRR